jgi:Tfp pilus assembly protein PilX
MSTIKVDTIKDTNNVEVYTAKAWVNFDGTGTVAIRAFGNVSSITDNGTGNYTVNFTTAMSDADYSTVCGGSGGIPCTINGGGQTTSDVRLISFYNGSYYDASQVTIAVFR